MVRVGHHEAESECMEVLGRHGIHQSEPPGGGDQARSLGASGSRGSATPLPIVPELQLEPEIQVKHPIGTS